MGVYHRRSLQEFTVGVYRRRSPWEFTTGGYRGSSLQEVTAGVSCGMLPLATIDLVGDNREFEV